jgi:hypothetical protein
MASASGNLELFETEFLKDFHKITITAIADYNKDNDHLLITGNSNGEITLYKREGSKLSKLHLTQVSSNKIDKLLVDDKSSFLYILSEGSLFIRTLPTLKDLTPKESDKESKLLKDIVKIIQNGCPGKKGEIMIISKKKKMIFYGYNHELGKFLVNEYKDADKRPLDITLKDIPDKIKWYGEHICYYLQQEAKVIFYTIENIKKDVYKLKEAHQDIPVEDIVFIQSSWALVFPGGLCFFFGTDGQNKNKNMISLNQADPFIELEIFNDLYIVSLHEKSIGIYDYNDEKCVQELTTDTSDIPVKKFLTKATKSIFLISTTKKEDKGKQEIVSNLWELREFSFEKQIKLSLKYNQIEKAFGILNNKLEYNMDKFVFLESFYCDCAWNCFKKRNKEGYEEAEKYFSLCNFNPFELMYHFILILKIKPIHPDFQDIEHLPKDILDCQINGDISKDQNVAAALKMLITTLQLKKNYLMTLIETESNKKGKALDIVEETKNKNILFESSQNCVINLKDNESKDIKLFHVIKMMNEVLMKGMVLMEMSRSSIEELIENDQFNDDYSDEFLSNINTFTSKMALAYIYKKNKKYSEAFKILEKYVNDLSKTIDNKESRNLLQKILIGFGKNYDYAEEFEQGLRILLTNHYLSAFEILLTNELISIDNFLEILNEIDTNSQNIRSKKELFLKLLCEDKKYSNYSNEKNQTAYMELLLNKLFNEYPKEQSPPKKGDNGNEYEGLPDKYKDFKELFTKFTKYNKSHLLNLIKDSWMYDIIIYLLTETQKYEEAIEKLVELVKDNYKDFDDIKQYCKSNYKNDVDIFKQYFKILKKNYDDEKVSNDMKQKFKKEMLKILELFINGQLLDEEIKKDKNKLELLNLLNPKDILELIPNDWKLNEPLDENNKDKTLFNLLRFYLKEYAIINNNYKRLENLAQMDLIYKQLKLYDLRDKHVLLDTNTSCYLCNKKIQNNTVFLVYPNGHIYHSRCSPDLHIEIKTGRNFENFDY